MARSKPPVTLWVLKVDKTSGISAIWFITHSGETAGALPRRDQFSRALVLCDEEEGCYTPQLRRPGPKTHRLLEQAVNTAARNKLLPFPGGIGSYMIVTLGYPFIIFSVRRGKRLAVWHTHQEHTGCLGLGVDSFSQQEVFISVHRMNKRAELKCTLLNVGSLCPISLGNLECKTCSCHTV